MHKESDYKVQEITASSLNKQETLNKDDVNAAVNIKSASFMMMRDSNCKLSEEKIKKKEVHARRES